MHKSPLRYPGGKGKLANFLKLIFEKNDFLDSHYIEPYAGGAALALELLFQEYASHIHINDLDISIFSFWHSVLVDTEGFCKMIRDTPVNITEWYKQKEIQKNLRKYSLLELGFSTFFLNRTNRSGIINGGIIGGKDQTGEWKIDARYNKKELIFRIEKIARFASRISLYNTDAVDFISDILLKVPDKALLYLDPPYYVKGSRLYKNYYKHQDHVDIAKLTISLSDKKWIVSYDNNPEIKKLYKGCKKFIYNINYSAGKSSTGSEIMFFSKELKVPNTNNPIAV